MYEYVDCSSGRQAIGPHISVMSARRIGDVGPHISVMSARRICLVCVQIAYSAENTIHAHTRAAGAGGGLERPTQVAAQRCRRRRHTRGAGAGGGLDRSRITSSGS
ncbi:MAG: hypothetical protein K0U78_18935 [Actinomycetia bacterium]|nr:hypothetical protein [Actinomycetes bacterium]